MGLLDGQYNNEGGAIMAKMIGSGDSVINTVMDKMVAGDGNTTGYQLAVWGLRVRYTGAGWEASTTIGATDQAGGNVTLTWVGTDPPNRLRLIMTGVDNVFSGLPACVVSPTYIDGVDPYIITAGPLSATEVHIGFWDTAFTPAAEVKIEDTQMDFHIIMSGKIG